jgi:hypothetical protein
VLLSVRTIQRDSDDDDGIVMDGDGIDVASSTIDRWNTSSVGLHRIMYRQYSK